MPTTNLPTGTGPLDTILFPLKWAVATIMAGAHKLFTWLGMDPGGGWTWVLSIVALVVIIRILLIPLFRRQIKATRAMQLVQPELQKLQKKYKGKTDTASKQAQQQEMMAIYKDAGTSPFASCMPILLQMPIFFSLYRVLIALPSIAAGVYVPKLGALNQELATLAENADIFGASLNSTFLNSNTASVKIVTGVLILLMCGTTLFTQRQLTMKNMPASAMDNPMARQQKTLMYIMPVIFAFTGVAFPIGVLLYWCTSNLWSMGQQYWMITNAPAPGSEAEKAYKERQARKAARRGTVIEDAPSTALEDDDITTISGQRQQPKRKGKGSQKRGMGLESTPDEDDEGDDDAPAAK